MRVCPFGRVPDPTRVVSEIHPRYSDETKPALCRHKLSCDFSARTNGLMAALAQLSKSPYAFDSNMPYPIAEPLDDVGNSPMSSYF